MEIGIILNRNNADILVEVPDVISDFLGRIVHQPFAADNHGIMPAGDGEGEDLNRIVGNDDLNGLESPYVPDPDVALIVDGDEIW